MLSWWNNVSFANPEAFWLLLIPLFILLRWGFGHRNQFARMRFSTLESSERMPFNFKGFARTWLFVLRVLALCLLITAMARPQSTMKEENISTEGIDIVISIDVSGSMLARDFKPDRLEACKEVAADFVDARENDRMGLVVFAGESFTQTPITTDHKVLKTQLAALKDGMIEDGTAIGMGLATAVNRLKDSEAESKVIILLTDGVNNAGSIDPLTAADIAKEFGCRVYTIGVGSEGEAPFPFSFGGRTVYRNVEVEIDEELLKEIAKKTGGNYYRAVDRESLQNIYKEIDKLEKTKIEVATLQRVSEEFYPLLFIAGLLLFFELFLRYLILRSIP
ncbi:MAG: VWA domain-containing protein [Chitinophagales bacterium]